MSYTHHVAFATCTIKNVLDINDLCSQLYDYLTNHKDEAPEALQDCESFEEFADTIENYVNLKEDLLTLTMDTEESNSDCEIFDFITSHYMTLMSNSFMPITWITDDTREGLSTSTIYYDKNCEIIDVEAMLNARTES